MDQVEEVLGKARRAASDELSRPGRGGHVVRVVACELVAVFEDYEEMVRAGCE